MRRKSIMLLIFMFIGISIFLNCFVQEKNEYRLNLTEIGQNDNSQSIIFSTSMTTDEEIYDILSSVLKQYNANLYCFDVEIQDEKSIYTKYVLINNTKVFENLSLKSGRIFNDDETESDAFISTINTLQDNQIGIINSFDKEFEFQVKTMKTGVDSKQRLFLKAFVLQLDDVNDFEKIQLELEKMGIVVSKYIEYSSDVIIAPLMIIVTIACVFVLLLLVLYDLIKSYKQIGIEKMLGYDWIGIWLSRVVQIVGMEMLTFLITGAVCSGIVFDSFNSVVLHFWGSVLLRYFAVLLLSLGMISVPFLYVEHISVSDVVKNNKPFKTLLRFNMGIKCVVTVLLLIVLSLSYTQIKMVLTQKNDKYKNWEKLQNYTCVYELRYWDETFNSVSEENLEKRKKIYIDFNRMGAILADFNFYSPLYKDEKEDAEFPDYYEVRVNPNYLKIFPVKDSEGNIVQISESEQKFVVLIPEKYKEQEEELREYFEYGINGSSNKGDLKEIKIIWIQNNQRFFSCQLDVGIEEYNTITDPLVEVLTEENGTIGAYSVCIANTGDPFKIKIEDGVDEQAQINNVCGKYYDLNDIEFPSMNVYERVKEQIEMANELLAIYLAMVILLMIAGISIVMQNIYVYTEHNRKVLAVKRFLGYRFADKYNRYFGTVMILYLISTMAAYIFRMEQSVFIFSGILMLFEFLISGIYIKVVEQKKIIRIMKEG